jgi:hypothetical protein
MQQKARKGSLEIERLTRAGEALRLNEGKSRALLKAVPDLMFHLTKDGTYLDVDNRKDGGTNTVPPTHLRRASMNCCRKHTFILKDLRSRGGEEIKVLLEKALK